MSDGPESYKSVFHIGLMHESSGQGVCVTDWKGSLKLRVLRVPRRTVLTDREHENIVIFSNDVVELLNYLLLFVEPKPAFFHPSAAITQDSGTTIEDSDAPFLVDPPYITDRLKESAYAHLDDATKSRQPTDISTPQHTTTTFLSMESILSYDVSSRSFADTKKSGSLMLPLYKVISPSLLLYRLLCAFCFEIVPGMTPAAAETSVWEIALKTADGQVLVLKDDSGLAACLCEQKPLSDENFLGLVRNPLTVLCSDECPHPYDYVLAGSVA
ncbi:hypothetical protein DFS34DRAFT_682746 [Phlyctochytrium arcticum]|nr:hypothetical protein DFS34DRAFT_682746 [Phlyctochytrium arcticum]